MNVIKHNSRKKINLNGDTFEIKANKNETALDINIYNWDRDSIEMTLNYNDLKELRKYINHAIKLFNKTPIKKDKITPIKTFDRNIFLLLDNENKFLQFIKRTTGDLTLNYQEITKENKNEFTINIPEYHFKIINKFLNK